MFGSRSADETTRVFPLSCVCVSTAAAFFFKYVTHRRLTVRKHFREIIELFSWSVKIALWVSSSGLVCGLTRRHFSVFWLISHLKHRVDADTSRPRTRLLPFKRLFEVTVLKSSIPQFCFLEGWIQRYSLKLLFHGFTRIQRVKYERKRWSTLLIFDCESWWSCIGSFCTLEALSFYTIHLSFLEIVF